MRETKRLVLPGFEPGTFALSARRTTNCAIAPLTLKKYFYSLFNSSRFVKNFIFLCSIVLCTCLAVPDFVCVAVTHENKGAALFLKVT